MHFQSHTYYSPRILLFVNISKDNAALNMVDMLNTHCKIKRTNVTDTFVGTAVGRPATSFKLKRSGLTGRVSRAASSNSFCIFACLFLYIANSSACFKSLASRSGFPPMPIPPLAASRRRVSFAIVNCIFEFRNVFAFSNNLLSAKYNRNVVKSIYTLKPKLMRSAKQLVCDLFLSRNCEIKSFRQLMSSRATPSDTATSFEVISLGKSTYTVEIRDHQ
ncbi:hypothetical protein ALC53_01313 [Atta colombica]|uniref:Uncharacterized protein n=1 Tax=Atta colombica TaxID=520822 RepID=A0A195BVG1_9HYME|nr:hypothetical protein ALC53_01313 [Atta colombica]